MHNGISAQLSLVWYLAAAEFARRRTQSFGGIVWMVAVPTATIVTIWLALDLGLGMRAALGREFGHGLVSGMLVWLFYADALSGATMSIVSQPHLVKKLRFPVVLLPIASVVVAAMTHCAVAIVVIAMLLASGSSMGPMLIALPFFFLIAFLLAVGFGVLLAAANVFVPDVGQVLPAALGLWFWLTPIVWPLSRIPADCQFLAFINPTTLVVTGYGSALTDAPLPVNVAYLPLFAILTGAFCWVCLYFFSRMQYAFADAI